MTRTDIIKLNQSILVFSLDVPNARDGWVGRGVSEVGSELGPGHHGRWWDSDPRGICCPFSATIYRVKETVLVQQTRVGIL